MALPQNTVYVVDDDYAVRKTLGRALRKRGLTVETFESARAFLDAYQVGCADCIVLDLSMPGMGGLELQAELKRLGINTPIVFISGHGEFPLEKPVLDADALDFLEKPFKLDVLINRIQTAVDMKLTDVEQSVETDCQAP